MKTFCKGLRCAYCACERFLLLENDTFQCEACERKFDINLDGVEIDHTDKDSLNSIKMLFHERVQELERKKAENKKLLVQYSVKETQRKMEVWGFISLLFSIGCLLNIILFPYMAILSVVGGVFFFFAKKYRKKMYKKYHPLVVYYAHIIAEFDNKIQLYQRAHSRLTPKYIYMMK